MNLWHDKSYISPSGPEWVERGYAIPGQDAQGEQSFQAP